MIWRAQYGAKSGSTPHPGSPGDPGWAPDVTSSRYVTTLTPRFYNADSSVSYKVGVRTPAEASRGRMVHILEDITVAAPPYPHVGRYPLEVGMWSSDWYTKLPQPNTPSPPMHGYADTIAAQLDPPRGSGGVFDRYGFYQGAPIYHMDGSYLTEAEVLALFTDNFDDCVAGGNNIVDIAISELLRWLSIDPHSLRAGTSPSLEFYAGDGVLSVEVALMPISPTSPGIGVVVDIGDSYDYWMLPAGITDMAMWSRVSITYRADGVNTWYVSVYGNKSYGLYVEGLSGMGASGKPDIRMTADPVEIRVGVTHNYIGWPPTGGYGPGFVWPYINMWGGRSLDRYGITDNPDYLGGPSVIQYRHPTWAVVMRRNDG